MTDRRDDAADERDAVADQRDAAANRRDAIGDERDRAATQRDDMAEQRERRPEAGEVPKPWAAVNMPGMVRAEAAVDRGHASRDRGAAAAERGHAARDRGTAMADRQASSRDRENALLDDLTGVYTRAAGVLGLEREITRARRSGTPLILAFVDVDHLKAINDSRGHAAGDRLLRQVAAALRSQLRSFDLIFRYGGDEFVCVIAGVRADIATMRLGSVSTALAAIDDQWKVTVGITELQPEDSTGQLLERADAALYDARRHQRDASDQ